MESIRKAIQMNAVSISFPRADAAAEAGDVPTSLGVFVEEAPKSLTSL
jgi:hypothetical protein